MSFIAGTRITSGSGGTISSITGYTVHTFSTPGAATFVPRGNGAIEVLVVGGGGNRGTGEGGGGGGGAVFYNKFVNVTSGTPYPITIGSGGGPTAGFSSCTFNNATITAYNGGGGGPVYTSGFPSPNASGGGGGNSGAAGVGAGITGLGFPGGTGTGSGAGSGGGAGGAGIPGSISQDGGIGVSYSITGISSYYGAGGGAGGTPNRGIPGASYGTGGNYATPSGTPGAVIIRYPS